MEFHSYDKRSLLLAVHICRNGTELTYKVERDLSVLPLFDINHCFAKYLYTIFADVDDFPPLSSHLAFDKVLLIAKLVKF